MSEKKEPQRTTSPAAMGMEAVGMEAVGMEVVGMEALDVEAVGMENAVSGQTELLELFRTREIVRTADVYERGIPTIALTRLVRSGRIERVANATYVPADRVMRQESVLRDIGTRMPRAIVGLGSAAAYFGLEDPEPNAAYVCLGRGEKPTTRPACRLHAVWETERSFGRGCVQRDVQGVRVRIYGPARTVTHFFKLRRRFRAERAFRVLTAYRASEDWNPDELERFAEIDRVSRVMEPYLDALEWVRP